MSIVNTSTKQYYKIKLKYIHNPHWYDTMKEYWSLDSAEEALLKNLNKDHCRPLESAKIVVRTEITNLHDVEIQTMEKTKQKP